MIGKACKRCDVAPFGGANLDLDRLPRVAELAREVIDPVLQVVDGSIYVAIHVAVDSA